jgi:hypothetical protein
MIKLHDWVTTSTGGRGIVKRIAKDGSWADVDWGSWSKRMPTSSLIIQTSISIGDGWVATDLTRESELAGLEEQKHEQG